MADSTLPDSESVRQLALSLRSISRSVSRDNWCTNGDAEIMDDSADALEAQSDRITKLEELSAKMAEDGGLWFVAQTAAEAYLQHHLRKLCAAIEQRTPEECARRALTEGK